MRLGHEEKSAPSRAEILTRPLRPRIEKNEVDFGCRLFDWSAREPRLRKKSADETGSGHEPLDSSGEGYPRRCERGTSPRKNRDARPHEASSISFAARSTTAESIPARQSGTWPRQRAGGRRMRLQGLQ